MELFISELPYISPEVALKIANLIDNCSKLIVCNKLWNNNIKCKGVVIVPNYFRVYKNIEGGFILYFDSTKRTSWEIINSIPRKFAEEVSYLKIADCYYRYDEINNTTKNYIEVNQSYQHNFRYLKNIKELEIETQRFGATIEPQIKIDYMLNLILENLCNIKILKIFSNTSFLSLKNIIKLILLKKNNLEELKFIYSSSSFIIENSDLSSKIKLMLLPELKKIKKIEVSVKVPFTNIN